MKEIEHERSKGASEGGNSKEKIEVIAKRENPQILEIRSLRWGNGVGWYVQKTITVDAAQAKVLMRALRGAVVMSARKASKGNVIPFPFSMP